MNKKLKITFVRPPFEGMTDYCPPHMGIACLYGFLNDSYGKSIECSLVDAFPEKLSIEECIHRIENKNPDIVCITSKTVQMEQTIQILHHFKQNGKSVLVCGGNHVSVQPEIFIEEGADFAIVGEGEHALRDIVKYVLCGDTEILKNRKQIYGNIELSQKKCMGIGIAGERFEELFKNADMRLGTPNWELFDLNQYNENIHINKSVKALQVMASRGCPYQCSFCSSYLTWGTRVKYRTPQAVINEILDNISRYGITDMHFYDDNLMLNREWVEEFLNIIEREQYKFNWICLSRPEIIYKNRDLLPRMKECGCKGFELGFETYSSEVYELMHKKNNYESFLKAYDVLRKYNFEMIEFLIMDFYFGETLETLYETYRQLEKFKRSQNLFAYSRYFATPFMGTQFYEEHLKYGHDLVEGNQYKYAVFLNYMPESFLDSTGELFYIDPEIFDILYFVYNGIEQVVHKNEFEEIGKIYSNKRFAKEFNTFMQNKKSIRELCGYIAETTNIPDMNSIEEYVARMIEFAARVGAMKKNENSLC